MKKLVVTLALVATTAAVYAQGTVNLPNSVLTAVNLRNPNVNPATTVRVPTTEAINYGVFWGTTSTSLSLVPTLATSSTEGAGLIFTAAGANFLITGSTESSPVYLQIKGWKASFGNDWAAAQTAIGGIFGQTDVRQVTLGPTAGPGVVIWQGATGTNPNRFNPLTLNVNPVPEPTSFALAGLGAAALLIFRRRN